MSRVAKARVSWGLVLTFILFASPHLLTSQTPAKGNLVGFVYEKDGSTPVAGAVVLVKNVTTGSVLESTKSNELGVFKVEGLGAGIYALGVTSDLGSFNSLDFVGVAPNETAKVSIALRPYDPAAANAVQAVTQDQQQKGESFVGRVVNYSPESREAQVFVERGLLQSGDRIRIRGGVTDFYQDAKSLRADGVKANRVLSGQTGIFPASKSCAAGDSVYVVCKRGVPPFFLAPLGVAAIVAGSAALVTIQEEDQVSPVRPGPIKK